MKLPVVVRMEGTNVDQGQEILEHSGLKFTVAKGMKDAAEKVVAAQEQQWLQSQKVNNPDLVAPLLAEKFVETLANGQVHDKAEALAIAKKTKYDSVGYTDVKVTVYGNAAVATGGFDGKGTDEMGKPFDDHERWTDTWVKMPSGKWQCVASADVSVSK